MASSGTAESFLTASSITRTRQAHQITACSLHKLAKKAYQDYCPDEPGSPPLGLEDGCVQRRRRVSVPVLESDVRYGAGHIYSDPFFQRRKQKDAEGVLDQTTAHRVKLPGTDHMFVKERLHQKVQMPSFLTGLYSTLQLRVSTVEL